MSVERSMSVRLSLIVGDFIQNARSAGQSIASISDAAAKPTTAMQGLKTVGVDLGRTMLTTAGAGAAAMATWGAGAFAAGAAYNTLQQTAGSALETVLGSAEAATAQMSELAAFAKTSPFPRQLWIEMQQLLLGFGFAAEEVVPTLSAIQDGMVAVGGSAQTIEEVVNILARVSSTGKVTAGDLSELGNRGIDAATIVGEAFGQTAAEIRESITAGAIDVDTFLNALLTQMQVRYGGAAEGLRTTWVGALDRIKGATRDVGAVLAEPFIDPEGGGAAVEWANGVADAIRAFESRLRPAVAFLEQQATPAFQNVTGYLEDLSDALGEVDIINVLDELSAGGPVLAGFGAAAAAAGSASVLGAIGMGQLAGAVNPLVAGLVTMAAVSPEVRTAVLGFADAIAPLIPELVELVVQVSAVASAGVGMAGSLAGAVVPVLSLVIDVARPLVETASLLAEGLSQIPGPALAAGTAVALLTVALKAAIVQVKTFGALSLAASLVGIADAAAKASLALKFLVAGAVIYLAEKLASVFDETGEELEQIRDVDLSHLITDLKVLMETGRGTGGLKTFFGEGADSAEEFADKLDVATAGWDSWSNFWDRTGNERNAAKETFTALDAGMAQLVDSGEAAGAVLNAVADGYSLNDEELQQLLTLLPQYNAAADRQKAANEAGMDATGQFAEEQDNLAEATDRARLSLKELSDEIRAKTDPTFAAIKAVQDLNQAERDYQDAVEEHGATSDEAREAMLAYMEAQIAAGTAAGELADATAVLPPELVALAEQLGLSAEDIEWLQTQFEEAQGAGEDFADAIADINADITTSTGRMQVENALIYSGMSETQARTIVNMKANIDDLIASGLTYEEAIAAVAQQSGRKTWEIEQGFQEARAAGLEFSDEYPAEILLYGDQKAIDRINALKRRIDAIDRTVEISFQYTGFMPKDGANIPGMSTGGPVEGPFGAGDVVPRMLQPGEHVLTVPEVQAMGGHAGVKAMRAAALAGETAFAQSGGGIGYGGGVSVMEPSHFTASAVIDLGEGIQRRVELQLERHDRDLKRRSLMGTGANR